MNALLRNCVNGEWVETGHTFPNINPINGSKICDVSEADQSTVACAVGGAYAAMRGKWGSMSATARAELLYKVADRISVRFDDSLKAEIDDMALLFACADHQHSAWGCELSHFADLIKSYPTEAYELATPDGGKALTTRRITFCRQTDNSAQSGYRFGATLITLQRSLAAALRSVLCTLPGWLGGDYHDQ